MALDKQVHLYSVATDAFYTNDEILISNKLSRLYKTRATLKDKITIIKNKQKRNNKSEYEKILSLYKHQLKRLNKIISKYKKSILNQFQITRQNNTIRELNTKHLKDKNVVSIFESSLTRSLGRETNKLTKDLFIVKIYYFEPAEDIVKNGFLYNGEKYVLFSSSAGQIRTKKLVMIKESALLQIRDKLTCGLSWDIINSYGGVNANKYLAYYSLNNSATEIWDDFNIDKAIVVEDFETLVEGEVDFIDDATYKIERKLMEVPIPHTDGCGYKLNGKTQMIRMAWFKGLMGVFDFRSLILEWRDKYNNDTIGIVNDIYGKKYDIISDDIEFIFTKSQFKMWKYYSSWQEYKDNFKKYHCEACVCNVEEENIKYAKINYQMLQTLSDIKPQEMKLLAKGIIKDIENLGDDYRTMMKVLGVNKDSSHQNSMQKSLQIYPEIMRDKSNRIILKECKDSLVKNAKSGKLPIEGKYTFVLPDLYAFSEWLFLGIENPKGLLSKGEVSCSIYSDNIELDCLRSPHLYREHSIKTNVRNENTNQWFQGNAIYTSTQDLISKTLQFDVDGDKLLVVADKRFIKIAKRNMKGIVPLYYDMKKALPQKINSITLYNSLSQAYKGGNIGMYSNNISKIWNDGKITQEKLDVIKILCMENNFCIDMAKTLYMPTRPDDINNIMKKYTNLPLPYYFHYAKNKDKDKVNKWEKSPINMLDKIIPNNDLRIIKNIGKLDYRNLLSDKDFELNNKKDIAYIMEKYDECNFIKSRILKTSNEQGKNGNENYVADKLKEHLLSLGFDKDYLINTLVTYLYTKRKQSIKKTLWECFGEEIYNNIKINTQDMDNICPICGKRFKPKMITELYCSNKCYGISNVIKQKNRDIKKVKCAKIL